MSLGTNISQEKCDHVIGYDFYERVFIRASQGEVEYMLVSRHDTLFDFCPDCGAPSRS